MQIVMLGAPGTGKGTQAKRLMAKYGIVQVSTGEILRSHIRRQTELGRIAAEVIGRGELVPDNLILEVVERRLQEADCKPGFILDGFPRTVPQAEGLGYLLDSMQLPLDAVLAIDVDPEKVIRRLMSRYTCSECGADYNSLVRQIPDRCNRCGGKVTQRQDDNEETIRYRLEVYRKSTLPLIEYYEERCLLHHVDGDQEVDDVTAAILDVLD